MKINGNKYSYADFLALIEKLLEVERTTGSNHSPAMLGYTVLNLKRMLRLNRQVTKLNDHLQVESRQEGRQKWVVITEAWCGDSAQVLPVIAYLAHLASDYVDLTIILRDEHPEWIEKYHTNGSRSIPKWIAFDDAGQELFVWGPRPKAAQELMLDWKVNPNGRTWNDFEQELHTWYAKDKMRSTYDEAIQLLIHTSLIKTRQVIESK